MLALAGMPLAWPWRQEQEEPCVGLRAHLVALLGLEVGDQARAARLARPVLLYLHLTRRDHHPGALVDLVLLEPLPSREIDGDDPRLGIASQDLRLMRLHVQRGDVPGLHASARYPRGEASGTARAHP